MFGPKLRAARTGKSLTLSGLAAATGTSKGYLSGVENEKVSPPRDYLIRKLARVLGTGEVEFLRIAWLDRMPKDVRDWFTSVDLALHHFEKKQNKGPK